MLEEPATADQQAGDAVVVVDEELVKVPDFLAVRADHVGPFADQNRVVRQARDACGLRTRVRFVQEYGDRAWPRCAVCAAHHPGTAAAGQIDQTPELAGEGAV